MVLFRKEKRYYPCKSCQNILDAHVNPPGDDCPHCEAAEETTSRPVWTNRRPKTEPALKRLSNLQSNAVSRFVVAACAFAAICYILPTLASIQYRETIRSTFAPLEGAYDHRLELQQILSQNEFASDDPRRQATLHASVRSGGNLDRAFALRDEGQRGVQFFTLLLALPFAVVVAGIIYFSASQRIHRTAGLVAGVLVAFFGYAAMLGVAAAQRHATAAAINDLNVKPSELYGLLLYEATRVGMMNQAAEYISRNPAYDLADARGYTALHFAAERGMFPIVRAMIAQGAPLEETTRTGNRPLHLAVRSNRPGVVRLLLAGGARVNQPNDTGDYPVHLAYAAGNLETLALLAEYEASLNQRDSEGMTVLHHAAMRNDPTAVTFLTERGAPVDPVAANGYTPFQLASERVVNALRTRSARWTNRRPPLLDMLAVLVAHGANVNTIDRHGRTVLHWVTSAATEDAGEALGGYHHLKDLAAWLLDQGAKPGIRSADGRVAYAAEDAVRFDHIRWVRKFLEEDPTVVNQRDAVGRTLFQLAMELAHGEMAAFLLANGADVDAWTLNAFPPLHYAASKGLEKVVAYFAFKEADLDARDASAATPLHYAAANGHLGVVEILLEAGAKPQVWNNRSETPLMLAEQAGHADVVARLVDSQPRAS